MWGHTIDLRQRFMQRTGRSAATLITQTIHMIKVGTETAPILSLSAYLPEAGLRFTVGKKTRWGGLAQRVSKSGVARILAMDPTVEHGRLPSGFTIFLYVADEPSLAQSTS